MKFEISEENQRKFNIVLGIIFVIANAVGIPLTIVNNNSSNASSRNQPFTLSDDCKDDVYYSPPELVETSCIDELIEIRLKVTRIEKRINNARNTP